MASLTFLPLSLSLSFFVSQVTTLSPIPGFQNPYIQITEKRLISSTDKPCHVDSSIATRKAMTLAQLV